MKKIITIFVMVMFLMSGVVVAEKGPSMAPSNVNSLCTDHCGDGICAEAVCLAEGCPCAETPESCPEDCPGDSPVVINKPKRQEYQNALKLRRQITAQQIQQARQRFLDAKERYLELRKQYQDRRQNVEDNKQGYIRCKGNETDSCKQIRTNTRENARRFLLKTAELVLNHIERVREKVNANEDLTEEELDDILAKLNEVEQEINDAKTAIEDLGEDATKGEIKEAAKTIRNAWKKVKKNFKHSIARNFGARLRTIIAKAEKAGDRLDEAVDKLEGDTSGLDSLVDQYDAYVDEAKEKYEEAKDKWEEMTSPGNVDEISREANALFKEANDALKNAHRLLKQIVKNIKEQGSTISSDDEDEEDDETEDDEDENE